TDLPVLPGHYDCLIKVEGDDEYNPAEFTKPEWGFDILKPGTEFIKATNFVVNATGYCAGDMAHVTFDVEVGEPTAYRLVFEAENKAINDIEFEPLEGGQYAIDFDIPDYVAGQYNLFVQFRDNDFRLSTVYSVPLHIDLTNDYLTDIWEDVVSVINKVDLSQLDNMTERFTAFQWYFNGEIIEGKAGTKPYYCQEGGLDGTYQLKVVTIDDETLFTCPKTFTPKNNKALSLKVYPNPVRSVVNIELSEDNDETHNLVITDNNGTVVVRTTFTGPLTQYDLSSAVVGHYVIMVDGLSVSVVKN
ncbi:MAG: T9SS type A sorting domain-containing protein, partial [Bacteroidales bacterium]|nr:T9SS type A sorting domain-containing protein [Bacteroidales bacterium]